MTRLVSWDPGLRESGAAMFTDGRLTECMALYADIGTADLAQFRAMAHTVVNRFSRCGVDTFAFEKMQTRRGYEASHDNLINLSIISGMVAFGMLPARPVAVPANTWTRQRDKKVNAALVRHQLDDAENAVLRRALACCKKKKNHEEITDAIGIGLYALRRWQ